MLSIRNLARRYQSGATELTIFHGLNLEVSEGEQLAITGESGAGKSTLLHLVAGLDRPTEGQILYKGRDLTGLDDASLATFRNREIGFVWQHHHLLPEFTAEENVMMPLLVRGVPRAQARMEVQELLLETGLAGRGHHRSGELSGGEQQRVALARALAGQPSLLLADEPTGNLDEKTGARMFSLLRDLRRRRGLTMILVTHNLNFAGQMDRKMHLEDGNLLEAFATDSPLGVS